MKTLFIDHRERSGLEALVMKYCDRRDLNYTKKTNLITDYAFADVGIEAKTIHDYMGSLYNRHLDRQLQNLDDNYTHVYLLVHGTLDAYIARARKGGKRIPYARAFSTFIGSLARFSTDYEISVLCFPTASEAARFICKRFEKHGSLGSSSTYRLMRKTASEDRRVDILRAAGSSEANAKRLLEQFGSINEIASASPKELQALPGIGKITASRILNSFISEEAVADEKIKMKRA